MFKVQRKQCSTCIYRPDNPLDVQELERQVADKHGGFDGFRICHHSDDSSDVCCRGFWDRHKDKFAVGQVAQRLDLVEFVEVDNLDGGFGLQHVPPTNPVPLEPAIQASTHQTGTGLPVGTYRVPKPPKPQEPPEGSTGSTP